MIYLTEDDVVRHLDMARAIALVRGSFDGLRTGEVLNHPRRRLILPTGSVLHYMAAGDAKYFGAKVYSTNPKGAHFLVLLYRSEDGAPVAILEANRLGQIRTGAASGVATDLMARPDARVAAIIGTGFQALTQVEAVDAVRRLAEVRVWSRSVEKREAFAAELRAKLAPIAVSVAGQAKEALAGADIAITATSAKDPVFEAEWIESGTHINAVGSNQAKRREMPGEILRRASLVVVDSREVAELESGDLLLARAEGEWDGGNLIELKDLMGGGCGRTSAEEITIFKSNGLAAEDVAVAGWVYERAAELGEGRALLG